VPSAATWPLPTVLPWGN